MLRIAKLREPAEVLPATRATPPILTTQRATILFRLSPALTQEVHLPLEPQMSVAAVPATHIVVQPLLLVWQHRVLPLLRKKLTQALASAWIGEPPLVEHDCAIATGASKKSNTMQVATTAVAIAAIGKRAGEDASLAI
eukprot:TRINITY_DN5731_c0_g1_i1.p2 TRINITY_DN5731_c0_g1~~TRINITY_DN5731_c0_g1_i1.p2  ORF type:complete len:139 (+),score=12.15 TRINITY_DN5731_c0_g1_i1:583-999(+)